MSDQTPKSKPESPDASGHCGGRRPSDCSAWFRSEPKKRGYYWVYEIGNPKDRPQVFYWDGDVFLTIMKWDREICYDPAWSCFGPIRPPKIPTLNVGAVATASTAPRKHEQ